MTIEVLFLSEDSYSLGNLVKYKTFSPLLGIYGILLHFSYVSIVQCSGYNKTAGCNYLNVSVIRIIFIWGKVKKVLSPITFHKAAVWLNTLHLRDRDCAETCTSQQHVGYIQYNIELLNREKGISSNIDWTVVL